MQAKKLHIGCGKDIKPGWVNLDRAPLPGVDLVWDIEKLPLPFKDGECDEILAQDILEHVEYIALLKDLHRILSPGGKLSIRVPHFTSKNNFTDPTHKKMFSARTFDFFVKNVSGGKTREYYFDFHFDRVAATHITFERSSRWFFYNRIVEPVVNWGPKAHYFYESTGFSRLFPAENILVDLIK